MAQIENTVFISYRRKDISWALAVYQYLKNQNYDVFFDYTSIPSGDFEQIIISNIRARAHFVLILTPTALDRCSNPGDWLRREIETAIDEKRNIIPLFFDGFSFGSPAVEEKLAGKLGSINRYNGLDIPPGYFIEAMERLSTRYLNVPLDAVLHPVPTEVRKVVKEEQVAADKALVQKQADIEELIKPVGKKINAVKQEWNKQTNIRRYGIGAGILAVVLLGIFGVSSLIQNANGRETPIPTNVILTNTITSSPSKIAPAETITIEPSTVVARIPTILPAYPYKVVGGDSCLSIAIKFDVSLQSIVDVNQDLNCNTLFIGQALVIPLPTPTPRVNTTQVPLSVGSTLVSPQDGMVMVFVPAGQFVMGSDDHYNSEPPHTVVLDNYWIDQHEITNAMFAEFVEETGYITEAEELGSSFVDGRNFEGADWMHPWGIGSSNVMSHPVVHVSWGDALAYCSWADRRLPTEAEWEKAASWDDLEKQKYEYPWGNEFVCGNGVFNCNGYTKSAPVGGFLTGASPYGALDMAGNVWEWVSSLAQPFPYSSTDGREDLSVSGNRVARGGSWANWEYYWSTFHRNTYSAIGYDLGFRCAMDASE